MSEDCLVYDDASLINHGYYEGCTLKISSHGFEIKKLKTGSSENISPIDVKNVSWCQMAKRFGLKIVSENGLFYQISSLNPNEFEKISQFLSSKLNIVLKKQEISVKGKNQGDLSLESSSMKFNVDLGTSFEVPLKDICRVSSSKSEVGMEFHQNTSAPISLMEIRLQVPNESVQRLVQQLSSKADVIKATTDAIFCQSEISCLTPRGRYTLKIYPTFVELHGKTFDFKIPHGTIVRIFSLRPIEQKTNIVVMSIDPAVRQGQTRYPFIVIQFEQSSSYSSTTSNTHEPESQENQIHQTFCDIIHKLSQKKVYNSGEFKSHSHNECLSCSCKASNGFLYPLERGFLFIHKPTIYARFEEISCVDFARGTVSARTFDMEIDLRSGQTLVFNNIGRENYNILSDFCTSKNVKIRKSTVKAMDIDGEIDKQKMGSFVAGALLEDSDDEDIDYNPTKDSSSSSEEEKEEQITIEIDST